MTGAKKAILPLVVLITIATVRVHALDGCVDSPEDPTAILGIIAAAAAFGFTRPWKRIMSRPNGRRKD